MVEYNSYKKSSYDWLGKIPSHWEEKFLEQTASEKCIKNVSNSVIQVLSLSYGEIIKKNDLNKGLIAQDLSTYQVIRPGDIIMRLTDLQNDHRSLRTGLVKDEGIITSAYLCLVPRIDSEYLHYLLHAYDVQKVFYGMGGGVRQSIGFKDIRHMYVPVPPRAEQDQIVRFLDWKVSEINKLIGIRRKEIQELEALKSAVITTAITKGIDPSSAMKKTDVYYLPEVPATWEVTKLKRICKVGASINEQLKKHDDQDEVVFLPMENISEDGQIDCSIKQPIAKVKTGFSSFAKDDVIVAKITPCFENGKGACLDKLESDIGYGTTELFNLRAGDDVLPEYLYFITMTKLFRILGEGQMTGSAGQKRVPAVFIRDFTIGLPALGEQQAIVEYIHAEKERIDRLIATKHKQLSALTEFKSTVISDTVTGKIDVRNIIVPEYEHVDDIADDDSECDEESDETEMDEEV
ncbi:restriction endonuclease [Lactobacillus delbrueckii subsp. bulgaricus]|nr:restriction endonuclease [Lactobacillus delbrueckii subsp. bulgaricus]MBT8852859.1 restriction endonuclease [Lactobacillus delbrueckii subsp. bulgaricus]MBT8854531.1 restriction endonuclease [Lactobacillus delbrueckii subsp. bulgaricus]MBT8857618.1 restriction endonuclease [Lactobacillus delbrueckii subsp. bulgaricus]MBT8867234.1 restriction endonuclease [Lactobacillus delbrueckii subsp. bulgaricus]